MQKKPWRGMQFISYTKQKASGVTETWFAELVPKAGPAKVDIALHILLWASMLWAVFWLYKIVTIHIVPALCP